MRCFSELCEIEELDDEALIEDLNATRGAFGVAYLDETVF